MTSRIKRNQLARVLGVFVLCLCGSAPVFAQGATPTILPLGDSITQGGFGGNPSYRRALWLKLDEAQYTVDFVGGLTTFYADAGFPAPPMDFDLDHEGHSAWTADQLDANMETFLQGYDADIVLLHIGTNDLANGQGIPSTLTEIGGIIAKLRADNPHIIILLAKIIPGIGFDTSEFNSQLALWAPGQHSADSPVIVVDQEADYEPLVDNHDTYHPNSFGEEKIATRWLAAIESVLSAGNQKPVVDTGPSRLIDSPSETITLMGSVSDDSATLTHQWTKVSGPGLVNFANPTQLLTEATFSQNGGYVLRLVSGDSELTGRDEMLVQVGSVPDLAGYWPLDENSGTDAPDLSANDNDGTLINLNDTNWQPGVYNNGLCMDGTSQQQVSIQPSPVADLQPQSVTVSGWVKPDPTNQTWAWMAGQGDNYGVYVTGDSVAFYHATSGTFRNIELGNTAVRDGQWHHLAGSFDALTGRRSIYMDGVLLNSAADPTYAIQYVHGNAFSLGSMNGSRNFKGCLDEIRVYDRALSPLEIELLAERRCNSTRLLVQNEWAQVSMPCNPGSSDTVADILGDDLTGTYATNWVVYKRDEETTPPSYSLLALTDSLSVGEGYWIKTTEADQSISMTDWYNTLTDIPLTGVDAAPPADCGNSAGQCNKVGHPHNFEVCWANVLVDDNGVIMTLDQADPDNACQTDGVDCIMSRIAHKWTGANYATIDNNTPGLEGTLQPWDAFWVAANKPGIELRIPATSSSCATRSTAESAVRGATATRAAASNGWFIRLIAEAGQMRDDSNVFGQLAGSVRGYDSHDLRELEAFGAPYLTVVFPHDDWGPNSGAYASDYRGLGVNRRAEIWPFEVRASDPELAVTLSWEGSEGKGRFRDAMLIDLETGQTVPVQPGGNYRFVMGGESHRFRWIQQR